MDNRDASVTTLAGKGPRRERVLILPGIGDSGPDHWQSHWERANPGFTRVRQRDWNHPEREEWAGTLEASVMRAAKAGERVRLIAHSLACLVVAHWSEGTSLHESISDAFLVAPPDPAGPAFPAVAKGFSPLPDRALRFPGTVVASANDPYGSPEFARNCARTWGCRLIEIGMAGHINASSGLGAWAEGFALFGEGPGRSRPALAGHGP